MRRPVEQPILLMNQAEFEKCIKDYARFDHMVFVTDHVTQDRADRRITRRMILRTLRKGTVTGRPKWDTDHQNWVGKIQYLGSGMDVTAVCAIREGELVVTVVTVYGRPR
ncbi:DUF4258 domain-containing protein [uncultured Roseobacter sp.]|uniref:DUF4258 domain-containing protein n=1 Tax=uncultured Roseobacter sp. TaxID=114847 RepID=UPI003453D8A0